MSDVTPAVTTPGGYASVEHDGWRSDSNSHTEEQLRKAVGAPSEDDETAEAAAKLGKKGGEAAAKARKAKPVEKEEPEAAEEEKEPAKEAKPDESKAEEAEDEKPENEFEKRKRGAKERVERVTREAAELKRTLRQREEELADLRRSKPAPAAAQKPTQDDSEDPEPQIAEGEDEVAFLEKKARWWARDEARKIEAKSSQQRERAEFEGFVKEKAAVVKAAIDKEGGQAFLDEMSDDVLLLEPVWAVMERGEKPGPLNALADEIFRAGDGSTRLMRYFTEHPDVLQRFSTLRPTEFYREFGKIEARLDLESAATAGKPAPVRISSQAPKPARPVAGSPAIADSAPGPDASYDEHRAYYNALERRKRSA